MRIAVLGAGAWGCALGCLLVETGHDVSLWEFDATAAARLASARWHDYLGVRLPEALALTSDMASTLRAREPLSRARALHSIARVLEARGLLQLQKATARPTS